jgi:dolichol-phosphate mannosyltransferase
MNHISLRFLPQLLLGRLPLDKLAFQVAVLGGLLLDVVLLALLYEKQLDLASAQMLSYFSALAVGSFFLFPALRQKPLRLLALVLLILLLRGGIIGGLVLLLQLPILVAAILTALTSALLFWTGYGLFISPAAASDDSGKQTVAFVASVVIYALLLRLAYLGLPELFFEEAYYWNYSRHLDTGYLDHPPLVAWLIAVFTRFAGSDEFGVRLGSYFCWVLAAVYSYRLARDVSSNPLVSLWSLTLLAVMPVFFFTGFIMTPDALLIACWAATVFYLHRALVYDQGFAWLGAGFFIGLGMLAKYTMALLPLTVILYVLLDRDARKWLFRYQPYLGAAIALLLFSPVIAWNLEHDWVSFSYQSVERAKSSFHFDLPKQLGSILLLLTPTIAAALFALPTLARNTKTTSATPGRASIRLLLAFMLVPLAIFLLLSTARESKYYWTAPIWLSVIPLLSCLLSSSKDASRLVALFKRAWPPTILVFLVVYAAILHYWSLGFPTVPYRQNFHLLGWHGFAEQVEQLVDENTQPGGQPLPVVGLDRHKLASGLTFYRSRLASADGESAAAAPVAETTSSHLFGMNSLMYGFWFPYASYVGRDMILISDKTRLLEKHYVIQQFDHVGEIGKITYDKNGRQAGTYYYRLAYGYRGNEKLFR